MKRFTAIFLAALLFFSPSTPAPMVMVAGPRLFVEAPAGTDPYVQFPALDLLTIPFHAGSGAWGAQLEIEQPTPPTITSSANAATEAELESCMAVAGRRCTITANITGSPAIIDPVTVTDVEVVIPNGIVLNGVVFGSGSAVNNTAWTRVRFTKASGDTIGGQVHQFRLVGLSATDIIVDGLQISGNGEPALYPGFDAANPLTRAAFVNNRIHSETACFGYGGRHIVFAGNSCKHNSVDGSGILSSWGFRQSSEDYYDGPYVFFQNDIRGINFFQIRFHPTPLSSGNPHYTWTGYNILLDRTNGQMIGVGDLPATDAQTDRIDGIWVVSNQMYVNGSLSMTMTRSATSINPGGPITPYARVNANVVHGHTSGLNDGGAEDGDTTGNTYNAAAGSDPAWAAAGDPTGIDTTP